MIQSECSLRALDLRVISKCFLKLNELNEQMDRQTKISIS